MTPQPAVAVLLATYNGQTWLHEQIDTILDQQGCTVRVIASDDLSSDNTRQMLAERSGPQLELLPSAGRMGSAGQNFFHLIEHADIGPAEYIAFADQDDHWLPGKLERAIAVLRSTECSAYSSDFWAWYPHQNDRKVLVRKSQPQQQWDHLFQGPGPGCTFVLTRAYFNVLRQLVCNQRDRLREVFHHDWLFYAHVRSLGKKWHIDDQALMLYRQHANNETGVSLGWRAARKRLGMIRNGWLRKQLLCIAAVTSQGQCWPVQAILRLHWQDRLKLALHIHQLRRSWRDRAALAMAFLFLMPRP